MDLPVGDDEEPADMERCAMLWSALPRESRCVRRLHPECEWGVSEYMLRSIDLSLKRLWWAKTKDGEKGRNAPRPIATPAEAAGNRRRAESALSNKDEIDRILRTG